MKKTELLEAIIQKQDEILKIVLPEIMVDEFRECVVPLMELYNLNQQLEKSKETKLSLPLDVPTDEEIIDASDDYGGWHSEDSNGYSIYGVTSNAFRQGAKWAIEEIKRRNKK